MKSMGKVAVLYGGTSAEREVSLMSGQGVYEALKSRDIDAHLFDLGQRTLAEFAAEGFDRAFIALHGRLGEDGTVQGALELLHVPYTGSGPQACSIAMDKIMTKRLWQQAGLQTPKYRILRSRSDLEGLVQELGLPIMLKAPNEGSTLGLYQVKSEDELLAAYEKASTFDSVILAEQFVRGRELTVAVIGTGDQAQALPVIEIVVPGGNYDYEHKYFSDDTQYLCPAPLSPACTEQVRELALNAFLSIGCSGWGRVDVMLDEQERPWLLEINASPGMTSHSLVPMAAKAIGLSYDALCVQILDDAACKVARPKATHSSSKG